MRNGKPCKWPKHVHPQSLMHRNSWIKNSRIFSPYAPVTFTHPVLYHRQITAPHTGVHGILLSFLVCVCRVLTQGLEVISIFRQSVNVTSRFESCACFCLEADLVLTAVLCPFPLPSSVSVRLCLCSSHRYWQVVTHLDIWTNPCLYSRWTVCTSLCYQHTLFLRRNRITNYNVSLFFPVFSVCVCSPSWRAIWY